MLQFIPQWLHENTHIALGKGDDNESRSRRGSFAESLSLPRAKPSAKLSFAESLDLPRV
jgi:hypothetical protein